MAASIVMRHKSFTYKVGGSISHDNQVNIIYRRRWMASLPSTLFGALLLLRRCFERGMGGYSIAVLMAYAIWTSVLGLIQAQHRYLQSLSYSEL